MAPAGEPDGRGPVALNRRRPALSPVALFALVFYASLCVTPFLFPSQLFAQLGRGTWVVTPLELLVALWGLWVIRRLEAWLDRRVGARRGAVELWAPRLFGRLAGNLYLALLAGYFLLSAALGARVLDEILRVEELPETSVWLLAPATLLPAFVPAALGLAAVARSAQVLLFVVLPGLLAILLWPLGQATWQELLPLTTALDALRRLGSPLALASLCVLRGYVPLLLLAGRAASPRWPRPALLGFAAASLVDLTGFVAPVAVLGLPYAVRTTYPFMETIETIRVGFLPVEHLAMLTLLIWQASVFVFGALYLWAALELLTRWLPPGPWGRRLLLAAMMAATLALAGWRIAPPQEQRLLVVCNLLGAGLGILLPSLALLLSLRARAGGASGLRPRAAARGTAATAEPASRHAWRRGSALLLLLALLLGTAGCGDVEDIDKRALVVALALDAAPGGALRLTVQFPAAGDNFTGGGGGGTGGRMGGGQGTTAGAVTLQARAASWSEAVAALARRTGRALDLRTVDAVLVGEALARRGITDLVGALLREPAISKTADVLLVRGQAGALLASRPPQGTAPMATRLSRLVRNGLTRTVTDARPVALWELGRDLMTPYRTASLPEAAPGPAGLRVLGMGFFRQGRLAGTLEGEGAETLGWLERHRGFAPLSFRMDGRKLVLAVRSSRAHLRLEPGRSLDVRLTLGGTMSQGLADVPARQAAEPAARQALERAAAREAARRLRLLFGRLQQLGAEPLGLGAEARAAWPQAENDWPRLFSRLPVRVTATVQIDRSALGQ